MTEHDAAWLAIDDKLEKIGTPEATLVARALRILVGTADAQAARIRTLELAVSELASRVEPGPGDGTRRTVFGILVELAPGVDDQAVRDAVSELPASLGAAAAVAALQAKGLLVRLTSAP